MENPECKTPSSNMDEEDQKKKRSPLKSPQLCGEDYPPNNLHLQMARLSDVTSDRSAPSFTRSTTESRNKETKKNVASMAQKNRISPLRSPRLCEDLPQVTYRNLEIKVGSQSSNKARKNSHQTPKDYRDVFEERLESEVNNYTRKLSDKDLEIERLISISDRLELDHKDLQNLLSERKKEKEELKDTFENDKEVYKKQLFSKHKEIEKLKSNLNNDHRDCKKRLSMKDKEIEKLEGIIKDLEVQVQQNREEHEDDLQRTKLKYENKLQEYLEVISSSKREISRLTSELQKRIEEKENLHETSIKRERETKLEKIIERIKEINNNIMKSNVEKEDKIRTLERKLEHVENIKEMQSRRLEEVSQALQTSEKNFDSLHKEFEEGNRRIKQFKQKEGGINDLQMQLDARMEENNRLTQHISRYSDRVTQLEQEIRNIKYFSAQERTFTGLETVEVELADNKILYKDLPKQLSNLKTENENADNQISCLAKTVYDKERQLKFLQTRLERSEENVSVLSKQIEDMREFERQAADEKLKGFQTENVTLKSALTKATTKIEDLSIKCTNLSKYRTDAEQKINELSKAVELKINELLKAVEEKETLRKHLARSEERISELSKEITDIKVSKRQTADEKLQGFQAENASLKSALSKATTQNDDLSNKCTNLQKYRTDAEHKLSKLSNAVEEKEYEIKSLNKGLARAEEKVLALSNEIKDIQYLKSQITDDKLQSLQKQKSLESALAKKTSEMRDLLDKYTNLQKNSAEADQKLRKLSNTVEEKENEIDSLKKDLTRSEENVAIFLKDIKNIQESKRQVADEKLQDLQTENASLKLTLAEATTKIDDLWNKCTNLQKYKSDTELEIRTLLNTIEEKETEIETLHKHLARSEKHVSNLSKDIKDIEGSKRQAADKKVQGLKTENASLKSALAEATNEIDALRNKCTNLQKYKTDTEHTINTMFNAAKEKETESETLNRQLTRENNELSKDISNLKKDKENAENQRQSFSKALKEKEKEIEIMRNDIARYSEKNSTLTKNVEDIKGSKNQAADENIKGLQKKIRSLESDFRSATTEYKDLSKELTNVKQEKKNAEYQIRSLSDALYHKQFVQDKLTRDIEDIQESKRLADEKLKGLQTENSSLKSALSKATNQIEDLLNKGTNLQKYKTDAEHKTSTLMNVLKEKETEIEALREQLARIEDLLNKGTNLQKYKTNAEYKTSTLKNAMKEKKSEIEALRERLARAEKNVSILSQDIKDIQASKRQVAEEKLQDLQTENASLKSALCKATNEIDDLRNKCTNLEKYKTDTEHTINTMFNAAKEKETEYETLNKQLARMNELSHKYKYLQKDKENAERTINNLSKTVQQRNKEIDSLVETLENYDQIRHDSNEAKRERDHDFKRLTSVAEGNGKRDSKGLM